MDGTYKESEHCYLCGRDAQPALVIGPDKG